MSDEARDCVEWLRYAFARADEYEQLAFLPKSALLDARTKLAQECLRVRMRQPLTPERYLRLLGRTAPSQRPHLKRLERGWTPSRQLHFR